MVSTQQTQSNTSSKNFFSTRRGRIVLENLTAYALLAPAAVIIFLFGIFPVAFAFAVSLHQWRRFPGDYRGLDNYVRALGDFGYVLFFWIAIGIFLFALRIGWKLIKKMQDEENTRQPIAFIIPAIVSAFAIYFTFDWFFKLLFDIMEIPQRIRGMQVTLELFMSELVNSTTRPDIMEASGIMVVAIIMAAVISYGFSRAIQVQNRDYYLIQWVIAAAATGAAFLIMRLTVTEIQAAIDTARESGQELPIWSQVIFITLGAVLIVQAWYLWQNLAKAYSNQRFVFQALAAILIALGGVILITELPILMASSDTDLIKGFNITVMFAVGTVPVQLALGMGLAYLLFQDIKGKAFFRIVYFIPYITPFVATSIVFTVLFSNAPLSVMNRFVGLLGIPAQQWLLEPTGIGRLIFGKELPEYLAGPALALIVIMIYSIWTYIGYNTVVFLAGLGNIPGELYEAARIDGASRWHEFRFITFPLLSPTTFFLSLIAVIGTFKAFTQIWIMRQPSAYSAVDTASVYIFEVVRGSGTPPRMGYGSSMAFVLFGIILVLTLFQNRVLGRRVFYG